MPDSDDRSVLVTGVTGFIGAAVLDRLLARGVRRVLCLVRHPDHWQSELRKHPSVECVSGDLSVPGDYLDAVGTVDTILHMAAATGAAGEKAMHAVNVEGTGRLLDAARATHVARFVFISSIAVKGRNISDYPYALSKREAESLVQASGLPFSIVRPTIVLGQGLPNWETLRKLACLPVVPLFGGARARIQPIALEDVAEAITEIALDARSGGAEYDLGGPETLTFAEFLERIRIACGKRNFPAIPVPYAPARALLRILGQLTGGKFPVSPAQLAPFVNDGLADSNAVIETLGGNMVPLDELLNRLVHGN